MIRGTLTAGAVCLALGAGLAAQRGAAQAPTFQVDPLWPKPMGHSWILGSVTGVAVDARDHIWLVHRGMDSLTSRTEAGLGTDPQTSEICCAPAPFVLEFDATGAVLGHWGGPGQGYDWPQSPGGMAVDAQGNVWIAAAGTEPAAPGGRGRSSQPDATAPAAAGGGGGQGRGAQTPAAPPKPRDAHVLKFSSDGKFLLQIGKPGDVGDATSTTKLNRPANVEVDSAANEVYVADGGGNDRIVVFDANTGAYKRHFALKSASCARLAKDGTLYGCDRKGNRIVAMKKDGTVIKEGTIAAATKGEGAVWDVAFSRDPQQRFLYVADGSNQKVWVLDRNTLAVVSTVGAGGRWPGHFYGVGAVGTDSKGNLYTGETLEGKRLQKFNFKGLGAAKGEGQ